MLNEQYHGLLSIPNSTWVIGWAGNVACLGESRGTVHTGFWQGKLRQTDCLEDLDADGMIMLKLMLGKQEETSGLVFGMDQ